MCSQHLNCHIQHTFRLYLKTDSFLLPQERRFCILFPLFPLTLVQLFIWYSSFMNMPCNFRVLFLLYQSFKTDCCLTNSDAHVIGGSEDGFIYFWDLVDPSIMSSFQAHSKVVKFSIGSFVIRVFLLLSWLSL